MAGEDPKYAEWIRSRHCCACCAPPPVQLHHRTGSGMGLRAHDHQGLPLCAVCHREFHSLSGRFKGWVRDEIFTWQKAMADGFRTAYEFAAVSSDDNSDEWVF